MGCYRLGAESKPIAVFQVMEAARLQALFSHNFPMIIKIKSFNWGTKGEEHWAESDN